MSNPVTIRARRVELGLRQRDVAAAAGVSATMLRQWERGLAMPSGPQFGRLASVLDTAVDRLSRAQEDLLASATPGEGYATARAARGRVIEPARTPPPGRMRVLDLFCGAGGLSYGFEQTGQFATTCGVDLLPDRIATFTANHPYAKGIADDITAYSMDELAALTGDVDVVIGGPPCQGFSSIRPFRTPTETDPRNRLVEHYALVISRLQPQWFLFENVVGLLKHENGRRLEALLATLEAAGYSVAWRVLNAALFGVPQHRERVVIVGGRDGRTFAWPNPTCYCDYKSMAGRRQEVVQTLPLFSAGLPPPPTLMDAIGDLPSVRAGAEAKEYATPPRNEYQRAMRADASELSLHRATRHSARMLEIIRHAGANISALPPGMVTSGFSSCYSRLDADRPSTTLTVNFVHPASNRCIHPHQDRALTPREGARIQSFPDRFEFKGTTAQVVKQIGNAVPPTLGRVLAEAVLDSEARSPDAADRTARPDPHSQWNDGGDLTQSLAA